ncbi:hypothetical protein HDU83_007679 [Entophlyctis luteolus]|nr:hypothetical protein HDU83_007679 [Entophlyctis luteolus]
MFQLAVASFAASTALHAAAAAALSVSPHAKVLSAAERVAVAEKLPSTVNAVVVSAHAIYTLLVQRWYSASWIDPPCPPALARAFEIHAGFTLYDLLMMLADPATAHFSSWAHHLFGLAGVCAARVLPEGHFIPAAFMPAEATVVVSNALYLAQLFTPNNNSLIAILLFVRCLMFTVFRLLPGPIVLWHMVATTPLEKEIARIDEKIPKVTGEKFTWDRFRACVRRYTKMPLMSSIGCAINGPLFVILNTYWTVLTYSAFIRFKKRNQMFKIHHI